MTTVTITLKDGDGEEEIVEGTMKIEGHDGEEEIELTSAVIFGETIMRALPNDGMWALARGLVPEAFEGELEEEKVN